MCFHGLFFSALLCVFCPSPFTKKPRPQPSFVGVVFRGYHERRAGVPGKAVRAMERNAEKKKHDLKSRSSASHWTARCCSRAGQPVLFFQSSEASRLGENNGKSKNVWQSIF